MKSAMAITETQLVAWCLRSLALRGLSCWRQNTGAMRLPDASKRAGYRFIKFGKTGAADITGLLRDGRRIEVECKIGSNKQSPEQVEFQRIIEHNNGIYLLVYSAQDLLNQLTERGI